MPSSSTGDVAICRAFFDHAVFLDGVRSTTNGRAVHGTVGAFASLAGDAAPGKIEAFFFCWSIVCNSTLKPTNSSSYIVNSAVLEAKMKVVEAAEAKVH